MKKKTGKAVSPDSRPIRLALIGLDSGFFCDQYVTWVQVGQAYPWFNPLMPKTEVTAVATLGRTEKEIRDNLGRSSEAFRAQYNLTLYRDAEELYEQEKPDGVFICGRPSMLPALATEALKRGLHVYVQKPAGVDPDAIAKTAALAKKKGLCAASGQSWLTDYPANISRNRIRSGDIGKLCSVRVMYNHGMPLTSTWYFDKDEGGPEVWLGWYPINLIQFFTGERIRSVFATSHAGDGSGRGHDNIIHICCRFASGVIGSIDFYGNIYYSYARSEWELLGEHGIIRNHESNDVETYRKGHRQDAEFRNVYWDGIGQEIALWLHSWKGTHKPALTLDEAAYTVRVSRAVTRSLQTRAEVKV